MSFLDQMRPRFSPAVRQSGETCFAQGLVDIRTLNPRRIEATVREKRKYTVGIDLGNQSRVEMSCTCPHFLDWGENCKHLWATLIEADQRWSLVDRLEGSDIEAQAPEADNLENDGFQKSLESKQPTPDTHDEAFILPEHKRRRDWRILLSVADTSRAKHKRSRESSQQFFPFFILDRESSLQRGQVILKVEERYNGLGFLDQ